MSNINSQISFLNFTLEDVKFTINMWKLNIADRYLGSALGVSWAVLNPLIMFALFTFVFGFVFKARLPGSDTTLAYSIWLVCGYGPWIANTEAIPASAQSIISNAGLVKNLSFKTEILPISAAFTGLIPLGVSLTFLLLLQILDGKGLSWMLIWLPAIIATQFIFLAAIGLVLAPITTFIRDFGIALPNLLTMLLFATPIFYPITAMPSIIERFSYINPFYIISEAYRSILLRQEPPNLTALILMALISCGAFSIALGFFRRIKGFLPAAI